MPRTPRSSRLTLLALTLVLASAGVPAAPAAADERPAGARLADELGRNEVRVYSAPYPIPLGARLAATAIPERLDRLGYRRVSTQPAAPGEYFWGHEVVWIYRRAHTSAGRPYPPLLFGLDLERASGRILGFIDADRTPLGAERRPWIEPEILAESLTADRARRILVDFDRLPEHVWRTVLAAEDHRFFEHSGLDAISIARALLANAMAGGVEQGGSTVTQQLVKLRDLSPRRTFGRKLSEAVRALALEAEYDKREILASYLDHVYYGHVGGLSVYGLGTAARAFFGKPATALDLGEAAMLAAIIQGPNRLSPVRSPGRVRERQRWVLSRMEELGWADGAAVERALRGSGPQGLPGLRITRPEPPAAVHFLTWVRAVVEEEAPKRLERGRGFVVQTTLDPWLQARAEAAARAGVDRARRLRGALRGKPLAAALVALDATSGEVLAYVGGDPRDQDDAFDRARRARRQTGSALKPLVLLEAFDDCGRREPLTPAQRVLDEAVTIELPSGPWSPENFGRRFRGVVDVREALVISLNVPFVRIARWCGFEATAETMRRAGLAVPAEPPPAFVLGALGTTPVAMAAAFTPFATLGEALRPLPVLAVYRPGGARIARFGPHERRVASPAAAYLVRDLMADVVRRGTATEATLPGLTAWGKTGTSSDLRDAWFTGGAGSVVTAAWVGLDDGSPLGLTGTQAAVPFWREFMAEAAPARPPLDVAAPREVVERWVQGSTGRLVDRQRADAHRELFDRRYLPPSRRFFRPDPPLPPIE